MSERQITQVMAATKRLIPQKDRHTTLIFEAAMTSSTVLIMRLVRDGILAPGPNWEE